VSIKTMKKITMNTQRRAAIARFSVLLAFVTGLGQSWAQPVPVTTVTAAKPVQLTTVQAPDAFVRELTAQVLATVRADKSIQSGDVRKVEALVNSQVLPYLNFQRMTSSAVGKHWRQATPDQQKRLQQEFKALLLHTYAGAIAQIRDQTVDVKPLRASPDDTQVVVRTLVRGRGDPIQLDYRLEKTPEGWKIYDVNVLGAWLVQNYKSSFSQDIASVGLDGLIAKLADRNKQLATKKAGG
jgi:phospholipid transport system substrate-binding protein